MIVITFYLILLLGLVIFFFDSRAKNKLLGFAEICVICQKALSKNEFRIETKHNDNGAEVKHLFCNHCYKRFRSDNPHLFEEISKSEDDNGYDVNSKNSIIEVLEFLDAAEKMNESVRVMYHGKDGSRLRMIKPFSERSEYDHQVTIRKYLCLEDNMVKNFKPSKMEIITEDGEMFGLGVAQKVESFNSPSDVRLKLIEKHPEWEGKVVATEHLLQFMVLNKKGEYEISLSLGLEYGAHREFRPWAVMLPDSVSYFGQLNKAANHLLKNSHLIEVALKV